MNLQDYLKKKQFQEINQTSYREMCQTCRQPTFSCYCEHVRNFDSHIKFVILIHPIESRRRIATGRMSHLCLRHSHLIEGHDYSKNDEVNQLLMNSDYQAVVLYPGRASQNLSEMSQEEIFTQFSVQQQGKKKLVVFVIDGTWATARKMIRLSENLRNLPRVCFDPKQPSTFRVRKQPRPGCLSTIEAIFECIQFLGDAQGFSTASGEHRQLLYVFDKMVERQLHFIKNSGRPMTRNRRRCHSETLPSTATEHQRELLNEY